MRLKFPLTISALILTGVGVLVALERMSPGVAPMDTADASAQARPAAETDEPVVRAAPEAPGAGIAFGGTVLLAPPGTVSADIVLREDGGWEQPAATRPAQSRPERSRPAELILALPQSLPSLSAKARASLAVFLEGRKPRLVVTLPAAATEADRDELRRLLGWLR